jgi:hypothetical protein
LVIVVLKVEVKRTVVLKLVFYYLQVTMGMMRNNKNTKKRKEEKKMDKMID